MYTTHVFQEMCVFHVSCYTYWQNVVQNNTLLDFPGGAVVENPPANAGDTGSSPGLRRSHMPRSN